MLMGLLLALIVLTVVIYWLRSRSAKDPSGGSPVNPSSVERTRSVPEPLRNESVTENNDLTVVYKETPDVLVDLRKDAERSLRVVGSGYWVEKEVIVRFLSGFFFLYREPDNEFDENAVAVYGGERKFGYLSAATAAQYAPLLDQIGSHFIVNRDDKDRDRMWLRLPRIPKLRARINDKDISHWKLDHDELHASESPPVTIPKPKKELTGGYPLIGGPHSNGDQVFGYYAGFAADLLETGTPTVSSLRRANITPVIREVRIGDRLLLKSVDKTLVVSKQGHDVGVLTWKDNKGLFDGGIVEVQRVFIGLDGNVVNCGGVAVPAKWVP